MSKSGYYLFIGKNLVTLFVFVIGYKGNKYFSNFRYWLKKLLGKVQPSSDLPSDGSHVNNEIL